MGFLEVLTIVFVILKLIGVITWSWWLVTLPLWGGYALVAAIFLIIAIVGGGAAAVTGLFGRSNKRKRR